MILLNLLFFSNIKIITQKLKKKYKHIKIKLDHFFQYI